jgi:hypothetical protein
VNLGVCVIAPTGRDAGLIMEVLRLARIEAAVCDDVSLVGRNVLEPLGPLIIAEEALDVLFIQHLRGMIANQPPWSDLPILILTAGGARRSSRNAPELRTSGVRYARTT